MVVWALAKKELRLLLRDRMAVVVLLGMPLVFILLWGLMLGENFGQKNADEKLAFLSGPRSRRRPQSRRAVVERGLQRLK